MGYVKLDVNLTTGDVKQAVECPNLSSREKVRDRVTDLDFKKDTNNLGDY